MIFSRLFSIEIHSTIPHGVKGGPRCFRGLSFSSPNTDRSEFVRDFQDLFGPDPVRDLKIFAGFGPDRGFKFFVCSGPS